MENHILIKIASANCRGLEDYSKRIDVFNYLRDIKLVYIVCKIHILLQHYNYLFDQNWKGKCTLIRSFQMSEGFVYYLVSQLPTKY